MSGLEREELAEQTKAMAEDEQIIVVRNLADEVLLQELYRRYKIMGHMIRKANEILGRNE